MATLGSGIVSGVLATFLVLICLSIWNKIIVPWYEDKVYKDIRIDGKWLIEEEEYGIKYASMTIIKQTAHRVYGEITYIDEPDLPLFMFYGEFRNLILTATHCAKTKTNLDRGTFTLMVKEDGRVMEGFYAWYPAGGTEIIQGPYKWIRQVSY